MRGGVLVIVACGAAVAVALPVIAMTGSRGEGDLVPLRWENAALIRDGQGRGATLVVIYDTGLEDRARKVELSQSGYAPEVGLLVEPQPGLDKAIAWARCVRARVQRVPPASEIAPIIDAYADEIPRENDGAAGFTIPPLRTCRPVQLSRVDRQRR